MSDEVVFQRPAANRVIRAVRTWEAERGHARLVSGPDGNSVLEAVHVRVTSGTADGNGNYPAVVTVRDPVAAAWVDGEACKLMPPNGETLASGTRYLARPGGKLGADWLYVAQQVGSGGAALASQTVASTSSNYVVSSSLSDVTGVSLSIPSTGWYLVLADVGYDITAGSAYDGIWIAFYDSTHTTYLAIGSDSQWAVVRPPDTTRRLGKTSVHRLWHFDSAATLKLQAIKTGSPSVAEITFGGGGNHTSFTFVQISAG